MSKEDLLDKLLLAAVHEVEKCAPGICLKETDIFSKENNIKGVITEEKAEKLNVNKAKLNIIHCGDTDSSDDEDNKYYEEQKYNQCGKEVKHLLQSTHSMRDFSHQPSSIWSSKRRIQEQEIKSSAAINKIQNVYTDPIFGLRIINPLVSFTTLKDRMVGRESVSFSRIKTFVLGNISDKNWVITGVIVNKSSVKTSQKGNQFLIWSLSDLKDDIKTVSVFLFGNAYKQLWKSATGAVVGILNPTVLDRKDGSKDEACLSVDNAQKVMILGQSKDLGTCKSIKKNGEQCNAIVNINRCEFCIYHIKQEYQKCSKRSELQSNFTGKGLTALRNKVLGKNEVFYAGKLYTAIPAKHSKKLEQNDKERLQSLNSTNVNSTACTKVKNPTRKKQIAANLEISQRQRLKDLTLLEKLGKNDVKTDFKASHSSEVTLESSKNAAVGVINKLKAKNNNSRHEIKSSASTKYISENRNNLSIDNPVSVNIPKLKGNKETVIDLNIVRTSQQINRAKLNALKYIQKHGSLKKSDPNSVKKNYTQNKKRPMEMENIERDPKKQKLVENEFLSDRFKKMMEMSSKHLDLLDDKYNEEQEKYFHKLEMKEKMEEKMENTFKVPCKAVQCLKCKYTNFSASQFCKNEKHPLKVFDTFKRFFKCCNCGNRTQCIGIVPVDACKNCGSGKWERTGMMKEKTTTVAHQLSIRGGEQKFVNSVISDANINLLLPDE